MRSLKMTMAAGVIALIAAAPSLARAQEPFPGLDSYVNKSLQTWHVPGVSIAIVRNDSVLYTKGYGVLAFGGTQPVTDQTLFEIGSSSKAFTATIVAMLVGEGKMRYDAHLSDYLPGFRMADPVASNEVTLRDALTHRSGIARGELAWLGADAPRDEIIHRIRFIKPESPFRSRFSYQNMMFLAAGEAAARAAGKSWDELVKERIFTPLGMTSSATGFKGLANSVIFAAPHGLERDSVFVKPHMDMTNIAPAGSIISSAHDMAQWLRFQLNDGVVNGQRLVNAAAFRETHTPQILVGGNLGRPDTIESVPVTVFSTYGMGWIVEDYHRNLMWQHGGNTDGMTAAVGMLPEKKVGVVVVSNMNGAQLPGILMHYIFDRALGLPPRDLSGEAYTRMIAQRRRADSAQVAQTGAVKTNPEPPAALSAFAGTYADSLYGEAIVTVENGHLELKRGEWHGPLAFKNANNFTWTIYPSSPINPMNVKFEIGPDGKVSGLYFGIGGDVSLMGRKVVGGRGGRGGRAP